MARKTLVSSLLTALLLLALQGCNLAQTASIEDARARLLKQDTAGAEIDLKSFLQKNPESGEGRYLLGQLLLDRGDMVGAQIELERALKLQYNPNEVVPALARALVAVRKGARVITDFGDRKLDDPKAQAALLAVLASAYAQEGKADQATDAIARAVQASPESEVALLAEAKFTAAQRKPDEALKLIEQLLKLHPRSQEAWALKGDLLLRNTEDRGPAIEAYRQALEVNPKQVHARAAVVAIALASGDLKSAEQDLARLREFAPKHFSTNFLDAQLAAAQGENARARTVFQAILKAAPDHPQVLMSSAENEFKLDNLGQAEMLATKALSLVPGSKGPRLVLANVYLRRGEAPKAVVALAPLVARPDAPADVLALAAQASMRAGDQRQAEALFKRLAQSNPTDARLRTIVATSGAEGNSRKEVLAELQAISAEDAGVTADLALVNAHLRTRDWDAALAAIEAIERKQPNRPNPLVLRAQVLTQKGDKAGARQVLQKAQAMDQNFMPAVLALAALDVTENRLDDARQRFKGLLERQPKNATALMALAEVAQRAQAPNAEVEGYLRRAVEAQPQSVRPHMALVEYQVNRGDLSGALASANAAVSALPDEVGVLQRLAQVQLRLGDRDQALSTYGKLTSMQPKLPIGYVGQAQVYLALADYPQAQRAVERALERDPRNLDAIALEVAVFGAQKRNEEATRSARKLQERLPDLALGFVLESDVASSDKKWAQAEVALRKAITKRNPGAAPIKLHHVLLRQGRSADAAKFADDWQKRNAQDTGFAFYLADTAQQTGKVDEAERRYRAMLEVQPDHAIALNNLAMLLVQQGKPGAQTLIDRALLILPNEATLHDTQADVRIAAGQTDAAIESLTRAAELAPRSAMVRLKLARLLIQQGERAKAKGELDRISDSGARLTEMQREEMRRLFSELGRN